MSTGRGWFARQPERLDEGLPEILGDSAANPPSASRATELHEQALRNLRPPFVNEQTGRTLAYAAQFEATMLVYREMRALRKTMKKDTPSGK
jgi:hypothetical protein